jgi:hypothetical protein
MSSGHVGWTAAIMAVALLLLTPATMSAAGPVRFGSKLTTDTQPSNAGTGHWCDDPEPAPHPTCSWVMMEAYGRPDGGHKAPKDGTINRVRVISCVPGSFRVQLARSRPLLDQARVTRNGPFVSYPGDPDGCDDEVYTINVIPVSFAIKRGEQIAIRTMRTGALRCSSGGDNTLLFDPPLVPGDPMRTATEGDGCWMLVEFQYR